MILANDYVAVFDEEARSTVGNDVATPETKGLDRPNFTIAAATTLLVGIVPAVLWPGAVSWMCDEPMLVAQAHYYNAAHVLAPRGLLGTVFVPYGPLPTQIYQLLLLFTSDPRVLVAVRAFICSTMLAGALLWLAKTLRLTPWFAAAVMLAPYLWWSERVLWDASFALPLGVLGVAAYASFLATRSGRCLVIAIAALTLVPLIHLQGIPLFAAFVGHALWRHKRALLRNVNGLAVVLAAIGFLNFHYIHLIIVTVVPKLSPIFRNGYVGNGADHLPRLISLSGPFLGGILLAGEHFQTQMGRMRGPAQVIGTAVLLSKLVIPLVWIGIVTCAIHTARQWKMRRAKPPTAKTRADPENENTVRATIVRICLTCLLLQVMLAVSLRIPPYPQYCFGTFPIHILFAWFAIDLLQRVRLGTLTTFLWGLSLAYITLGNAWQIHRRGWNRYCMSPSLDNQMQVAQSLNRYTDTRAMTDVTMYKQYPMAIQDLRVILPASRDQPKKHSPHGLLIRYVPDADPDGSQIELIEIRSPSDMPAGAFEFDITPRLPTY